MDEHESETSDARSSVRKLRQAYDSYRAALGEVVEQGEEVIPVLIESLSDKRANPIAEALGLMMYSPSIDAAFPRLLDWVVVQSPLYPDVLEALRRAGERVVPMLIDRISAASEASDDEAIRNLLDLGSRLSEGSMEPVVSIAITLLDHDNSDVREAGADALCIIGLPSGRSAIAKLTALSADDPNPDVRKACEGALERLGV